MIIYKGQKLSIVKVNYAKLTREATKIGKLFEYKYVNMPDLEE